MSINESPDRRADRPLIGILMSVAGIGCIIVNDAATKWVITERPLGEVIFVRGLFALIPIALLVRRAGGVHVLRWHSASAHLLCAVLLIVPLFAFIYSLRELSLALVTVIFFTNPLFVTLLAPWAIGEQVGWRRRAAVMVGFVGAVIVIQPASETFRWVMLVPIFTAFVSACRDLQIRHLLARETSVALLTTSSLGVMAAALLTVPLGWEPLSGPEVLALATAGMGFGFGIYFMTEALRYIDASLNALYKYTAVVWALLLGYLVWGDVPAPSVWLGAAIIVGAGVYIVYRESKVREGAPESPLA